MPVTTEKLGELYVAIVGKTDKLEREIKQLRRTADKEAKKIGSSFKNIFVALGGIYALKKAFDFAVVAKNLARDAEEIRSKFDTVFEGIRRGANRMADDFARSFGVAKTTARELLSSTGDLLVGFGFTEDKALDLSLQVNSLAQDLASFQNYAGGAKGATEALTKAILGETESAKGLGIVIRQDTKEFKSLVEQKMRDEGITLQQAKALIILDEAMKQSKKGIGDYQRTKDSLANTERRFNETIKEFSEYVGDQLTPALTEATTIAIEFFRSITETDLEETIRKLKELGVAVEELADLEAGALIVKNLKRLQDIQEEMDLTSNSLDKRLQRISALFSNLGDTNEASQFLLDLKRLMTGYQDLPVEEMQKRLKNQTDRLATLLKRQGRERLAGGDNDAVDALVNRAEITVRTMGEVIALKQEQLKLEKEIRIAEGTEVEAPPPTVEKEKEVTKLTEEQLKEREKIISNYYETIKFEDNGYFEYRVGLINKEAEAIKQATGDSIKAEKFKISELTALWVEYFEFLQEQNKDIARGFDLQVPDFKELKDVDLEPVEIEVMETTEAITTAWEELLLFIREQNIADAMAWSLTNGLADALHEIRLRTSQEASAMEKIFTEMANSFIYQVQRMIAEWLAFQALKIFFSPATAGAAVGVATGGTFRGGRVPKKMASGGSMIVPNAGISGDYYPLLLKGGEQADITPVHKVGDTEKAINQLAGRVEVLTANMVDMLSKDNGENRTEIYGELEGENIYLSNKKHSRLISRKT